MASQSHAKEGGRAAVAMQACQTIRRRRKEEKKERNSEKKKKRKRKFTTTLLRSTLARILGWLMIGTLLPISIVRLPNKPMRRAASREGRCGPLPALQP